MLILVAFRIYDVNDDGLIDSNDLSSITAAVLTTNFNKKTLATILDKAIHEVHPV